MGVAAETPHDEAAVSAALGDAAAALRDRVGPLRDRIGAAISSAVPALASDADVRRARELSTEANVTDLMALLANPDLPVESGVPPEALGFATTLVRRGIDPADLAHAYLVGQNELWRAWMEELAARLPDGPDLTAALARSSARIFKRADFLVAELIRHTDRERARLLGGALERRSRLVRSLLAGNEAGEEEASRALGYDIGRWVLAVVLWEEQGEEDPHDGLEALAATAAGAAGAPRALTFSPGEGSLWAWIGTPEQPDVDRVSAALEPALADRQGVGLGTPGHGLDGFRRGHDEALHARRIAELGEATGVVRYDEVEAVSLLSEDVERLARFVRRRLGGLAADDAGTARLRETLLHWLAEGGNARRAAERMHAHKNTVLYRLQRAQQILGRPLDEDRGNLELALTALDRLGPRAGGSPR
jgi:DNA-binding PucR family transcriptional regulator